MSTRESRSQSGAGAYHKQVSGLDDRNPTVRIAFIGAPGTGKSTLAGALVPQLKCLHMDVAFCAEATRDYILRTGAPETPLEQFIMTAASIEREDSLNVHDYVVCDSASFTGDVFFRFERYQRGRNSRDAKLDYAQAEIARMCLDRLHLFDHVFYVPTRDFGQVKDPTRIYVESQGMLDRLFRSYLDINLVDYHEVRSIGIGQRVQEVIAELVRRDVLDASALQQTEIAVRDVT